MKKLFALLAMAAVASSAFGQVAIPGGKRKIPDVIEPIITDITIPILQVQQCDSPTLGTGKDAGTSLLPAGVTPNNWCFVGSTPNMDFPACRFVGGVLCIDPGPNGDFAPWLSELQARHCPKDANGKFIASPVIQGVKLRKIEPRVPKCPDVYPGIDFIQTAAAGIRTFWPLKFTPCNTEFKLSFEFVCVTNDYPRHALPNVYVDNYHYKVTVRPTTLRWVLEALHCQPLGACEVPCITDEGLFARLLQQADDIGAAATKVTLGDNSALLALNTAFDRFEAMLVKYALFTQQTWDTTVDKDGNVTLIPCALFGGIEPGNKTIDKFGFGIVDTFEHPCVCKLISDLVCLKSEFIGTDP